MMTIKVWKSDKLQSCREVQSKAWAHRIVNDAIREMDLRVAVDWSHRTGRRIQAQARAGGRWWLIVVRY